MKMNDEAKNAIFFSQKNISAWNLEIKLFLIL